MELCLIPNGTQVYRGPLEEVLGVGNDLVVDRWPMLGKNVAQEQRSIQIADLLVQILRDESADGGDRLASRVVRDCDG